MNANLARCTAVRIKSHAVTGESTTENNHPTEQQNGNERYGYADGIATCRTHGLAALFASQSPGGACNETRRHNTSNGD